MGQRKAVIKAIATRDKRAGKAQKSVILDEFCATTGWHRRHPRESFVMARRPVLVQAPRRPRAPTYGPEVVAALGFCWAVLGAPTGKRLAPVLSTLVSTRRRFAELDVTGHHRPAARARPGLDDPARPLPHQAGVPV